MENREHVSIEMEELANSLIRRLESLHPLSRKVSIYRVPEIRRCLSPRDFTPQMVSIGPLHHGKVELKAMEEEKERCLKYFLEQTQVRLLHFLAFIKESETKLRNCYAEAIRLTSDEFITMVLLDAVFLFVIFLILDDSGVITDDDDDRIFRKSEVSERMQCDLLLFENQLPLFILNDLFELTKTLCGVHEQISFLEIACGWLKRIPACPVEENLLKVHFSEGQHFLHLLMLCVHSSQRPMHSVLRDLNIPGAKRLHQAGVKFKSVSSKNLFRIRFKDGILEIPILSVYDNSGTIYRNLLAFEEMHGYIGYFHDYIGMMSVLINNPKDAELLVQYGIIQGQFIEKISTFFASLGEACVMNPDSFQYSVIAADLQAHCKMTRNQWKAALKQNYFYSPWASLSVIAAVILLLLTLTQTVCSIIAL